MKAPKILKKILIILGFVLIFGGAIMVAGSDIREKNSFKILFLGNSITIHGPAPELGWINNCGMAASAPHKDFVHLLLNRFAGINFGKTPKAIIENIADFERGYGACDIPTMFKRHAGFKPDIIILAIGENASVSASQKEQFRDAVISLLKFIKGNSSPLIVVRSSFWPESPRDTALKEACEEVGGIFVDISGLASDERNFARSGGKFSHAGVAAHPGDVGMIAIANEIWSAIRKKQSLPQ